MARHHVWHPAPDEQPLLGWFNPLIDLATRARIERIHWPVLVEHFDLVRRVDRGGSTSSIWTYRHRSTGGELHLDEVGCTYAYRPHPSAEAGGRFVSTPVRRAIYDAHLHRQPENLWYEFPEDREEQAWAAPDTFDPCEPYDAPVVTEPARRRAHLVLIPGG